MTDEQIAAIAARLAEYERHQYYPWFGVYRDIRALLDHIEALTIQLADERETAADAYRDLSNRENAQLESAKRGLAAQAARIAALEAALAEAIPSIGFADGAFEAAQKARRVLEGNHD